MFNLGIEDQKIINKGSGSDWTLEQLLIRFLESLDVKDLQHHKDTTVGLYATDSPIPELLELFFKSENNENKEWHLLSDGQEIELEKKFSEWAKNRSWVIS